MNGTGILYHYRVQEYIVIIESFDDMIAQLIHLKLFSDQPIPDQPIHLKLLLLTCQSLYWNSPNITRAWQPIVSEWSWGKNLYTFCTIPHDLAPRSRRSNLCVVHFIRTLYFNTLNNSDQSCHVHCTGTVPVP